MYTFLDELKNIENVVLTSIKDEILKTTSQTVLLDELLRNWDLNTEKQTGVFDRQFKASEKKSYV